MNTTTAAPRQEEFAGNPIYSVSTETLESIRNEVDAELKRRKMTARVLPVVETHPCDRCGGPLDDFFETTCELCRMELRDGI